MTPCGELLLPDAHASPSPHMGSNSRALAFCVSFVAQCTVRGRALRPAPPKWRVLGVRGREPDEQCNFCDDLHALQLGEVVPWSGFRVHPVREGQVLVLRPSWVHSLREWEVCASRVVHILH